MHEMKDSGIEWIGEIPVGWELNKIGSVYDERSVKVSDKDYAPLSVTKQGIVPQLETAAKTDNGDNRKLIKKGDFVINSRSDRRGSCGISEYDGSCSLINTVLKPRKNMCNAYYSFVFRSECFADEFYRWGTGIVDDLWSTKWSNMKNIYIPFPPLEEQHRISTYLDTKCEKIDSIIARQQEVIEKLKAYKLSVITEAVTKGLNPDVKMKDSGVEWIGDVPEHWEITSVARISTVVRGASPRPAGDPLYFNGSDVPWITVAEVTKDEGKYIYETETFLTFAGAEKSRVVEKGTLLLSNSGATLGVPKITCITGCINDGSLAFYDLKINQTYLLYIFKGRTFELRKQMQGYGQPNLNTSIVKAIQIPLPTENEQVDICNYLDKKCSAIDSAIAQKKAIIEKLTAYKKSLIYEVVTGKREVKGSDKLTDGVYAVFISPDVKSYAESLLFHKIINMAGKNLKGRTHLMKIFHAVEIVIGFDFGTQYIRHTHGPYSDKIESLEKDLTDKGWLSVKKGKHIEYSVLDSSSYESDYNKYFKNYDSDIRNIVNCFLTMKRTSKAEKFATLLASWNDFIIDGVEPTDEMIINDVRTNWTENKANTDKETWQEILKQIKKANIIPRGYGKHTIRKDN